MAKNKRPKRSKNYNRRYGLKHQWSGTNALATPVPNRMFVTMKYADLYEFQPSIGIGVAQVFRANSIFDPDLTGVGHQPRGHDELAVLYGEYRVLSAEIKVTCINNDPSEAAYVSLNARNTTSLPSTIIDYMEASNTKYIGLSSRGGLSSKTFSMKINPAHFAGENVTNALMAAPFGANPAIGSYLVLAVNTAEAGATFTEPVSCLVEIRYNCVLTEPVRLSIS